MEMNGTNDTTSQALYDWTQIIYALHAFSLLTGILGAVVVTPMMNALKINDWAARGFAVGLASHGIGTARAFSVHPVAGAFAGIAMGLNAVVTPALIPVILPWLGG